MASVADKIKLRAVYDFDPKHMKIREEKDLQDILKRGRGENTEKHKESEQRSMLDQNKRQQHQLEINDPREHCTIVYKRDSCDYKDNQNLKEYDLSRQDKHINPENELEALEDKVFSMREEISGIQDLEKPIKVHELEKGFSTYHEGLENLSGFRNDSEEIYPKSEAESMALPFKRGDKLESLPEIISVCSYTDGWWRVRHLNSGNIGFIPRNRVVMENDYEPSDTTFNQLPLELLDVVLENSLLLRILNSSPDQRDDDVIKSLESVDFCWFQRITRPIFKKRFLQLLKGVYGKTKKRSTIIRNNRNYLLENIHPNDELIDSLFSLNCITVEQSHFIQRQRLNRDKNAELLYVVRSFDERKFSNFVKCLRQTNQKTVARIIENGGGVIKIEVQNRAAEYATSMELHKKIEDLRSRTKPRSHQTDKLISQLWEEGIEILNSHLEGQTGVVWIWCHSQAALEYIQRLYESNQLMDILIGLANIQQLISTVISIDRNQFKKTIVVRPISINFTQRIAIRSNQLLYGLTKLRNEIYVLCTQVIWVFEDQIPFRLVKKIKVKEINAAKEIESNEVENCLYVPDCYWRCVWKITREIGDQQKIIKWLTTDYMPRALSVTSYGHLLMVNEPLSDLNIYGPDAKLIRSIHLSRDVEYPWRVVETSIGNFGILHTWLENDKGESGSRRRMKKIKGGICELVRDKHNMVVRRFIPSNETQQLNNPSYLLLDSDDQVFVADTGNNRVILLNSDFKWKTKEETGRPNKMCYDEERKQLIVGGNGVVNVYTLSRN